MDAELAVVGGGVVGGASALALARRGAAVVLLEAEEDVGLAASGTNSGIVHTGFDSPPGELETRLIRRSAALRNPVLDVLGVPVLRCGALLRNAPAPVVANAERNGVDVALRDDGALEVPGEAVTDPVAYTAGQSRSTSRSASASSHGATTTGGAWREPIGASSWRPPRRSRAAPRGCARCP